MREGEAPLLHPPKGIPHELAPALLRPAGGSVGPAGAAGHLVAAAADPAAPAAGSISAAHILARVLKREETPHQSPWWLTLLRLVLAALVIFALAEPVFNPRERVPTGGSVLALVMDNGWASAADWDRRVATAGRLIADAEPNRSDPSRLHGRSPMPRSDLSPRGPRATA